MRAALVIAALAVAVNAAALPADAPAPAPAAGGIDCGMADPKNLPKGCEATPEKTVKAVGEKDKTPPVGKPPVVPGQENKDKENKDKENKDKENKDKENKDKENKDKENKDKENKDKENKDKENKDKENKDKENKDKEDKGKDHKDKEDKGKDHKDKDHDEYDHDEYKEPENYKEPTKYEPKYPAKGYQPPKEYPEHSEYSKPNHPKPPKDCEYGTKEWPYPQDYPRAGNYGQTDNHGDDYAPKGYKPNKDHGVYSPAHGGKVKCGEKHKFKWGGFKGKKVQIDLVYGRGRDDCHHYRTITKECDNNGHYDWDVPTDLPPTGGNYGYGVKITCHDTGDVYYSPQFCFDNDDFYNKYKHPACPTEKPVEHEVPPCTACQPPPAPVAQVAASPCPTAAVPAAPGAEAAVPAVAGNGTVPVAFEGAASSLKTSLSFVAGLAALVAFAL